MCQASDSSPLENMVQLISGEFGGYVAMNLLIIDHLAAVIIFEHSFYIYDKRRHLRNQRNFAPTFKAALELYMASPLAGTAKEAVSNATQAYQGAVTAAAHAYEEAVSAAVYTHQGNLPAWMAKFEPFKRKGKQSFEHSQRMEKESSCSQAKAEFIRTIFEITLNHRLRMFHHHIVAIIADPLVFSTPLTLGNAAQHMNDVLVRSGAELRCFGCEHRSLERFIAVDSGCGNVQNGYAAIWHFVWHGVYVVGECW
jgi:hypothetical protein